MLDLHSLGRKVVVQLETFLLFGSPQQQIRTVISLPSNVFFLVGGGHLRVLICCSSLQPLLHLFPRYLSPCLGCNWSMWVLLLLNPVSKFYLCKLSFLRLMPQLLKSFFRSGISNVEWTTYAWSNPPLYGCINKNTHIHTLSEDRIWEKIFTISSMMCKQKYRRTGDSMENIRKLQCRGKVDC